MREEAQAEGAQGRLERRRAGGNSRGRRSRCGRAGRWAWARGARRGRACARRLGVLAGSVGPSRCTVHLAQF